MLSLLASVAAGAVLVPWQAARREARAEAGHPPEGRFLDLDGVRVHAVEMGKGPDVVLIHGSSGNARDMTFRLAPALADRYRVIAFDRPGLGYTDDINPAGASITEQADLLSRAAARMGAERPVVVGQSYGGAVALAWAVHHPGAISALVPVAAASTPWDTPLDAYYRMTSSPIGQWLAVPLLAAFVTPRRIEKEIAAVFAPQPTPEGYSDHFGPGLTLRRASIRANARQRANILREIIELEPRYPDIRVPTEIVHGTADSTVDLDLHSENIARLIPGAVLTRLPGIGHMPQHVATADVAAAIDRAAARAGLR